MWRRIKGVNRFSSLSVVTLPPEWTSEHASRLKAFLRSDHGQAFLLRARALEAATAIKACRRDQNTNPDRAAGFSDCLNWMESLATISESPSVTGETDSPRNAEYADAELSLSANGI